MGYSPMYAASLRANVVGQTASNVQQAVVNAASQIGDIIKQKNIDEKIQEMYRNELYSFADQIVQTDPNMSKESAILQARKIYKPPVKELGPEYNLKMLLAGDIPAQKFLDNLQTKAAKGQAQQFAGKMTTPIEQTRQVQAEGPPVPQPEIGPPAPQQEVPMEQQTFRRPVRGEEYEKGFSQLSPEAQKFVPKELGAQVKQTEEIYQQPLKPYETEREKAVKESDSKIKTMAGIDKGAGFKTAIIESQDSAEGLKTKKKTVNDLAKLAAKINNMQPKQIESGKQTEMMLEAEKIAAELDIPAQFASDKEFLGRMDAEIDRLIKKEESRQKEWDTAYKEWQDREQQKLDIERTKARKTTPAGGAQVGGIEDIAAYNLAREIGGVRGAKNIYPVIIREMKAGKSINEIRDLVRYSQQSGNFTGTARSAMQQLFIGKSGTATDRAFDAFDDLLAAGDKKGIVSFLKKSARNSVGVDESKQIFGKERTIEFLDEIRDDLANYEAKGGKTNIFTGNRERVAKKIGTVADPELRKIATKINSAIQNYRRAMSGVAFSVPESKEYSSMFPSIDKTSSFNTSTLDALQEVFAGDIGYFYSNTMGPEAYNELILGAEAPTQPARQQPTTGPQAGTIEDGYRFKGGDPADPNNWEQVQ